MDLTAADILGPRGSIAKRLPRYEHRSQQLQMAQAVTEALHDPHHLLVEAGTGVGKSFGYLVPAILAATANNSAIKRVVVSTHTISLQEQLLFKDLPLLHEVIPRNFSTALVKGRGNYLSLRRLGLALTRDAYLFALPGERESLQRLAAWAKQTTDGSLSELAQPPEMSVWDEVASDADNCLGKKCDHYADCFFYKARRQMQDAQVLVVNHSLLFTDIALRAHKAALLPDYQAAILDEAHTLEAVASEHLGVRVTSGQIGYNLRKLFQSSSNKGLLAVGKYEKGQALVGRCQAELDDFFGQIEDWWNDHADGNGRVSEPMQFTDRLSPRLLELAQLLREYAAQVMDESHRVDIDASAKRMAALGMGVSAWCQQNTPGSVYWIDRKQSRRGLPQLGLVTSPIDVSATLQTELFGKVPAVILTSATIAAGKTQGFDFIRSRIGLTTGRSLRLGSPFNFRDQVRVILPTGIPDPSLDKEGFERACAERIRQYVKSTDGHAFVLCTSYDLIRKLSGRLRRWMESEQLALYSQAEGIPRTQLLEQFRQNPRGVLFGTDTFWQGVDVPGDALTNVIIPKLPFSVPDQPLLQARLEAIRNRGGNPFHEYQLPEAVIKLKQGFGRLVRTQRDRGIVVILDPRVRTKRYGPAFLDALPDCPVDIDDDAPAESLQASETGENRATEVVERHES